MGFLVKAAGAVERMIRPTGASPTPAPRAEITVADSLAEVLRLLNESGLSRSGTNVTITRAMQLAAVYACVRILSESLAQLPLLVYRKTADGKALATSLPLFSVLKDQVNEWQTSFEWRERVIVDVALRGNSYAYKVRNARGQVIELLRMHPDRCCPKQDPNTLALTYEWTRPSGQKIVLPRKEVLHIRGLGDDDIVGKNPIEWFRETIGDAAATQEHSSRFWSNGAKPLMVLEVEAGAKIGETAQKALREDFELMYSGPANAYRTAILPGGVKASNLQINGKDAQFLETRKFQRSEIAMLFRVPPHMIGELERSTNNNIEHQSLEFVMHTLTPWMVRIEQAIARDLLDHDPSLYVKFNASALLRGDAQSRAEALQIQRRNGVINANEWRDIEDMDRRTDPGGDEYIIESNMQRNDGSTVEAAVTDPKQEPAKP
jgi:HK97 family phage portal protein